MFIICFGRFVCLEWGPWPALARAFPGLRILSSGLISMADYLEPSWCFLPESPKLLPLASLYGQIQLPFRVPVRLSNPGVPGCFVSDPTAHIPRRVPIICPHSPPARMVSSFVADSDAHKCCTQKEGLFLYLSPPRLLHLTLMPWWFPWGCVQRQDTRKMPRRWEIMGRVGSTRWRQEQPQ